jgi:hypothetical protein
MTFPIQPGDECFVLFADTPVDVWFQNGVSSGAFESSPPNPGNNPVSQRRHDVSDGIAIFGLRSKPRSLSEWSQTSMQIRSDDGSVVIDMKEPNQDSTLGQVTITAHNVTVNATQATVNGTTVTIGEATTIDGRVFLDHVHINVAPGVVNTGPVA